VVGDSNLEGGSPRPAARVVWPFSPPVTKKEPRPSAGAQVKGLDTGSFHRVQHHRRVVSCTSPALSCRKPDAGGVGARSASRSLTGRHENAAVEPHRGAFINSGQITGTSPFSSASKR
jgi:hypothetical protein